MYFLPIHYKGHTQHYAHRSHYFTYPYLMIIALHVYKYVITPYLPQGICIWCNIAIVKILSVYVYQIY